MKANEDYYGGSSPSTTDDAPASDDSSSSDKMDAETSLLPKSMFGDKDLEPGHICKVEIVKTYGDQVEVKAVPGDYGDDENAEAAPDDETAEGDDGHMASFDKQMGG